MLDFLLTPIEYLMDVLFRRSLMATRSPQAALLVLSIAVSLFTLPLYLRADAMQEAQRKKEADMEGWLTHIRRTFRGDERALITQYYYGIKKFSPAQGLGKLLPLLLQIPFFMAAYRYLGEAAPVKDPWFWQPDAALHLGAVSVNLLPLIMTGLNLVSVFLYQERVTMKERLSMLLLPAVFLLLLYRSPAGLVLYWSFNNLFSLLKNLFIRLRWQEYAKKLGLAAAYLCYIVFFTLTIYNGSDVLQLSDFPFQDSLVSLLTLLLLHVPVVLLYLKSKGKLPERKAEEKPLAGLSYFLCECCLFLFAGVYLPLSVIYAAPADFPVRDIRSLAGLLKENLSFWGSVSFVWCSLLLLMSEKKKRPVVGRLFMILVLLGFYDFFFWGNKNGLLLSNMRYENDPTFPWAWVVLSLALLMLLTAVLWQLCVRFPWQRLLPFLALGLLGLCLYEGGDALAKGKEEELRSAREDEGTEELMVLSKTEKNVVLIMLDRAVGGMLPYIMEEREGLREKFDGFCWYPNSISMGRSTNLGAPTLYGGYEYTPSAMNARTDKLLSEKHNEALTLLPTIFSENGYGVSVTSVPYGNYVSSGDNSVFDGIEGVRAHAPERKLRAGQGMDEEKLSLAFRDYSMFRIAPYFLQHYLYYEVNPARSESLLDFETAFAVLSSLREETTFTDGAGQLNVFCNYLTHEGTVLQLPDYTLPEDGEIDNSGYVLNGDRVVDGRVMHLETMSQIRHYHVNVAAYQFLADWFDLLREQGVYDNTRIVIASDHGYPFGQFDDLIQDDGTDMEAFNCLLMFKDFDAHGFTVSEEFMTNADAPVLVLEGLIEDPVNPFTGNPVDSSRKEQGPMEVTYTGIWELQGGTAFDTSDAPWYTVHDNIFIKENWEKMEQSGQ
ncbi:MAG: YidC/Oxa1 family membrane protein insertase [Lachnospiraceae bacterium]|nr:YidC/Oxa1 family membrane protein insertase [Lachnospiraceae bacterium]